MLAPLQRIIVFVNDVEKCAAFYRDLFELDTIGSTYDSDEWCELDGGGCRLAFHKAHGAQGATGSASNPHKIVFYAEDVAALREELVERGAEMDEVKVFGDLALCDGADPEGHRFQISNRK